MVDVYLRKAKTNARGCVGKQLPKQFLVDLETNKLQVRADVMQKQIVASATESEEQASLPAKLSERQVFFFG